MTNTRTVTPTPQEILAEHRELLVSIENLRDAWNASHPQALAASAGRLTGLRRLVERLREELAAHFAAEERGGYMGHVLRIAPQFTIPAAKLGDQHRDFLRALDGVSATLGRPAVSAEALRAARRAFDRFVDRLLEHEHAENEIVQSAFNTDVGAGD